MEAEPHYFKLQSAKVRFVGYKGYIGMEIEWTGMEWNGHMLRSTPALPMVSVPIEPVREKIQIGKRV